MSPQNASTDMLTALVRLREVLRHAPLPLAAEGVEEQRRARTEILAQLEDYLLPRLIQVDAPLLTVVGGSTGAGKSTLVNSLVGRRVTEPGVLRPTTRSPVLVHHPTEAAWFDQSRILPDLERTPDASMDTGRLQLVASETVPPGLAILDAPDIDSVEERNRVLAAQLLAAADLWLFVTSAARYSDQVPWEFLRSAAERSTAVAVVLDRTPPDAVDEVSSHLARMLTSRGLRDSPLFTVPESAVDEEGLLPTEAVADVRRWLDMLAEDAGARAAVVRQTLDGAIRALARRTHPLADALAVQEQLVADLRHAVTESYEAAAEAVVRAMGDGTLLRGEVSHRWHELAASGEFAPPSESRVGQLRDRMVGVVRNRSPYAERIADAVVSAVESLVLEQAERAAERTDHAWRADDAGRALSESVPVDLGRASRGLRRRISQEAGAWQQSLAGLVRREGADRRGGAGVPGLVAALTGVVLVDDEADAARRAAVADGRTALTSVYGPEAVDRLTRHAREDLRRRVSELLAEERARFERVLDDTGVGPSSAERLRDAARRVDDVRFATPEGGYL